MSRHPAPGTAEEAETAFYAAFENGDLDAMAEIWAYSDNVVCVHPHAPQLMGYDQVMRIWRDILGNTEGFRISVRMLHQHTDGQVAVRFVNETLIDDNSRAQPVTILATNAYRKTDSGWRMVLHHASPAPSHSDEQEEEEEPDEPEENVTLH
jgi:ketosteroid isomerase-like protein